MTTSSPGQTSPFDRETRVGAVAGVRFLDASS